MYKYVGFFTNDGDLLAEDTTNGKTGLFSFTGKFKGFVGKNMFEYLKSEIDPEDIVSIRGIEFPDYYSIYVIYGSLEENRTVKLFEGKLSDIQRKFPDAKPGIFRSGDSYIDGFYTFQFHTMVKV